MLQTTLRRLALLTGLLVLAALCACGESPAESEAQASLSTSEYAYLVDEETLSFAGELLSGAGIEAERQAVLFDHARRFAAVAGDALPAGFQSADAGGSPAYDPYALQDAWAAQHPDFTGYNCRITAFSLLEPLLRIDPAAEKRTELLMTDLLALEQDPSALLTAESREAFEVLFSMIPTVNSAEVQDHVAVIRSDWAARGISFAAGEGASLITVFFHDAWDEHTQELMIGHAGVLLEGDGDELYFLEKIAFQEPYRLTRFRDRTELNDYLMGKYDFFVEGQTTAHPFILENDALLEGYRVNAAVSGE